MDESSSLTRIQILGYVAFALFVIVMILQLLLAVGILPITMAWGGRNTELTPSLRLSSLIAIGIQFYFAYVIARRSGILGSEPPSKLIRLLSWMVTAFLIFNTVINFSSRSLGERWLFGPITLILVVLCGVISVSKPPDGKPESES